jgi:hypothetical protein
MHEDKKLWEVTFVCEDHMGENEDTLIVVAHFVKEAYDKAVEFLRERDKEESYQDESHSWNIVKVEFQGIIDLE